MTVAESQRLFFALWPAPAVAELITERMAACLPRCRRIPPANLHITLAFIGDVEATKAVCVQQAADRISSREFTLNLSQTGFWRRPGVVWIAPETTPAALIQLHGDLSRALKDCGCQPETRPYHPHLTLCRKARHGPTTGMIEPITMLINEFVLVQSRLSAAGAEYKILRRWPPAR
ncbi:MAG: RNA 2',3'-cyclic phosphodiesterase [Gammaproteobacteria bacterium]|nr:RNA 2',3'-cyclic phosphodiesterase [Gammaproteobacteria bacterium]